MPHYLSRIRINPQRAASRRFLSNPANLKAAVYAGMPTQPVTERVLWRLDADNGHRPFLYVVSPERPCFEHLVEQAGWPGAESPQVDVAEYTPFLARLAAGDCFSFRLTANPTYTVTKSDPAGATKKIRAAHKTIEHQTRWLMERLEDAGLRIQHVGGGSSGEKEPDLVVAGRRRQRFAHGQGKAVTIYQVTYFGHLEVTDPKRARSVLIEGLGRAKGYGCGLLTLAPPASSASRVP